MLTNTKKTEIIAEPDKQELFIKREFAASRELLFKAFSDPDLIVQWLGPHDLDMVVDKLDNRTHGSWRFIHKDAEGNEYAFNGAIHEVIEPESIVRTFEFEGMPGHVALEFLRIEAINKDRSKITIHVIHKSVEDRDGHIQSGMEKGVQESHEKLDKLLDELSGKENGKNIDDIHQRSMSMTRVFNAPVELLWKALTKPEYIKEWWGPEGFTNTIHEMDVRIGGKWLFIMHGPDGTDFENDHTYKEVKENERIVLQNNGPQKFEIIINLSKKGRQTEVKWEVIFDSIPTMEEAVRAFKADEGLKQNLERLARFVINFQ